METAILGLSTAVTVFPMYIAISCFVEMTEMIANLMCAANPFSSDYVHENAEITENTISAPESSFFGFIYNTVEVPIMLIVLVLLMMIALVYYLFIIRTEASSRQQSGYHYSNFPNNTRGGIIDEILKHLWRYMSTYVREELKSVWEKTIYEQHWVTLRSLDIGFKPDSLQTMFHLQPMHHNSNIKLSVDFVCRAACNAGFRFWFIPLGGIDRFEIRGKLNIEICPTNKIPFIDAINIFFTELPLIDIDMYGLVKYKKNDVVSQAANHIYSNFVLPNKLQFPMSCLYAHLITKKPI